RSPRGDVLGGLRGRDRRGRSGHRLRRARRGTARGFRRGAGGERDGEGCTQKAHVLTLAGIAPARPPDQNRPDSETAPPRASARGVTIHVPRCHRIAPIGARTIPTTENPVAIFPVWTASRLSAS